MAKQGRLTVLDLLILVAATAPGLALMRGLPEFIETGRRVNFYDKIEGIHRSGWSSSSDGIRSLKATRPYPERPSYWLIQVAYWTGPCLASCTFAVMALGLRRPRPPLRRIARRPSTAAGLALVLAMAAEGVRSLQYLFANGRVLTVLARGSGARPGPRTGSNSPAWRASPSPSRG